MATTIATLQDQVLAEYSQVVKNLDQVTSIATRLSAEQPQVLDQLRPVERKLGMVFTLLKASVWAVLCQREEMQENWEEQEQGQHRSHHRADDDQDSDDEE